MSTPTNELQAMLEDDIEVYWNLVAEYSQVPTDKTVQIIAFYRLKSRNLDVPIPERIKARNYLAGIGIDVTEEAITPEEKLKKVGAKYVPGATVLSFSDPFCDELVFIATSPIVRFRYFQKIGQQLLGRIDFKRSHVRDFRYVTIDGLVITIVLNDEVYEPQSYQIAYRIIDSAI